MAWWQKLLHRRMQPDPAGTSQRVTGLVAAIIHQQRFLGEALLQVPRQYDTNLEGVAGLAWDGDQLSLRLNPLMVAKMRDDDLQTLLEHEALHIVWEHPVRYAHYPHQGLVQVATDVAVNQYLPEAPAGTTTLAQLERLLRRRLPEKQDSQDYLAILEKANPEEQDRLRRGGIKLNGRRQGQQTAVGDKHPLTDTHVGWARTSGQATPSQQLRLANIRRLLEQAWSQTPQRDRGMLPGTIKQQLAGQTAPTSTPLWQAVLRRQLGSIVAGKQDSYARFNRRQPLRMDLPGQVGHLVPDLRIFVDNSGSVPDEELLAALSSIDQLVNRFRLGAKVYSFDARVNPHPQKLHPGIRVNRERSGGGGTSFQSIFDFLRHEHVPKRAVIVVITDGWGEATLRDHHYQNVFWLLTTERSQLSVPVHAHRVFELQEGK